VAVLQDPERSIGQLLRNFRRFVLSDQNRRERVFQRAAAGLVGEILDLCDGRTSGGQQQAGGDNRKVSQGSLMVS
jgi:hypothetical protein